MQTIKFKDVAHLYLGCKLQTAGHEDVFDEIKMTSIDQNGIIKAAGIVKDDPKPYPLTGTWFGNTEQPQLMWFRPVLKRFESVCVQKIMDIDSKIPFDAGTLEKRACITVDLTKLGIDLFNLIDSGEAIEDNQ